MELVRMFEEQSGVISNFGPLCCVWFIKNKEPEKKNIKDNLLFCACLYGSVWYKPPYSPWLGSSMTTADCLQSYCC